jgi:iron(III) transport system permease protein
MTPPGGVRRWRGQDPWQASAVVLAAVVVVYLVVVPLVFLLYGSIFTGGPGQPGTLSLRRYVEMLTDLRTYRLIWRSVLYATGATSVAFCFGAVSVWLVQRTDLPAKSLFTFFTLFPLFMPPVLSSISWVLLLDPNMGLINRLATQLFGIPALFDVNGLAGMIWVAGMLDVPLVFLWLWPALVGMDPALEEAARICHASAVRVIRTITLPMVLPALAAVFLINFVLAIEDVTVPIVIGLPAHINVFATEIYLAETRVPTDMHSASVYAVILLAITLSLTLVYRRLTAHTERYVTVRGRGFRPSTIPLGRARLPVTALFALALVGTVGLPVFILVWTSLSPYLQVPSVAGLRTLSTRWYAVLLADPMAIRGVLNTAILGVATAFIVLGLSVVIGWIQVRSRARFRQGLDTLAFLPIAIPGLVVGLSLMWLYLTVPIPVYGTLWILGIAFVTRFMPYGVRLAYAGFTQIHAELEEAAYVSGSGWLKTLRTVSLPLLAPTLMAGMIYTVLRAFRELSASLTLSSFGNEPFSVVAYHMWDGGETSKTAAYGVVAIVMMALIIVVTQRLTGRRQLGE